jgi:hypothetical protein
VFDFTDGKSVYLFGKRQISSNIVHRVDPAMCAWLGSRFCGVYSKEYATKPSTFILLWVYTHNIISDMYISRGGVGVEHAFLAVR